MHANAFFVCMYICMDVLYTESARDHRDGGLAPGHPFVHGIIVHKTWTNRKKKIGGLIIINIFFFSDRLCLLF